MQLFSIVQIFLTYMSKKGFSSTRIFSLVQFFYTFTRSHSTGSLASAASLFCSMFVSVSRIRFIAKMGIWGLSKMANSSLIIVTFFVTVCHDNIFVCVFVISQ